MNIKQFIKKHRCILLHNWTKWEQFKVDIPGNFDEIKQRKTCLSCNKVREEFVEFANYK